MSSYIMRKSLTPYDKEERYWPGPVSLDYSIGFAGNLHEQNDPITYLDDIREQACDVAAKRLGYTKSDDQDGNWHKAVA